MIWLKLIKEFLLTGLFSIGGGLATLPFLRDMAIRTKWFSIEELFNMIAISESTPGPIGLNMSTYAGIQVAGIAGGVIASLALVFPSFIIIWLLTPFLEKYNDHRWMQGSFYGLRAASLGLIAAALFDILLATLFDFESLQAGGNLLSVFRPVNIALFGLFIVALSQWKRLHPVLVIFAGMVMGLVLQL